MLTKKEQIDLINEIKYNISDFDKDLLIDLKSTINNSLSDTDNEDKFIELYRETRIKMDKLIERKDTCPYDIWQFIWERLFEENGIIHKAYKLVPFNRDIIDSSYEDEVFWIMNNWKDTVDRLIEERNRNKYFEDL